MNQITAACRTTISKPAYYALCHVLSPTFAMLYAGMRPKKARVHSAYEEIYKDYIEFG